MIVTSESADPGFEMDIVDRTEICSERYLDNLLRLEDSVFQDKVDRPISRQATSAARRATRDGSTSGPATLEPGEIPVLGILVLAEVDGKDRISENDSRA